MHGDRPGDEGDGSRADARCPRCGYDQRGVIESWDDACPLDGTCTECGLVFQWRELLDPARSLPHWCVEYSSGPAATVRTGLSTLAMSARPWRFWRELKMTHQPRWFRLGVYYLLMTLLLIVLFDLALGFFETRASLASARAGTWTSRPKWQIVMLTMANPFSDSTLGTERYANGWTQAIASPRLVTGSFVGAWNRDTLSNLHVLAIFLAMCPVGFLALPHSRKLAKVRWAHIARIAAYSMAVVPLYVIGALFTTFPDMRGPFAGVLTIGESMVELMYFGCFGFLMCWWSLAISRYLRMEHSWAISVSVCLIAGLLTGVIEIALYLDWSGGS